MSTEQKMIPESEAIKLFKQKTDAFAAEVKRLREVEGAYYHLLTLVKVVASQNEFALQPHLEIRISKQEQVASESWEDLLTKHFEKRNKSRIIGV